MAYYFGLDFGATRLRAGIADDRGEVQGKIHRTRTPKGHRPGAIERDIHHFVRDVLDDIGIDATEIVAAGIGSIGPLDFDAGTSINTPNLPASVERVELVETASTALGLEDVRLLNDSTAGLYGELFFRDQANESPPENMVYLTMSTGISAGVLVDGSPLGGNVGEVGHWIVDPAGTMPCGCGHAGHWEAYCGGGNVPDYARHLYAEKTVATDMPVSSPDFDARDVFLNYGRDDLATLTVEWMNDWNEIGLVNLIHAYDPEVVSIGGGLALPNEEIVIDALAERVGRKTIIGPSEVRPTTYGEDVVVMGALASVIGAE